MSKNQCFDPCPVEATQNAPGSDNPSHSRQALKHGGHFLVLADDGFMPLQLGAAYGLWDRDTRYINRWEMLLNGEPLRLLRQDSSESFAAHLTYGNNKAGDLREQVVLVDREIVIADERVHERITLTNFEVTPVDVVFDILHGVDFADMFEVRGAKRPARGEHLASVVPHDKSAITFAYRGLDERHMRASIEYPTVQPQALQACGARFKLALDAGQKAVIEVVISTELDGDTAAAPALRFEQALAGARQSYADWRSQGATITTSDALVNAVLERGYRDLYILRQPTPKGGCLAAGIPWFSVAFGRDQCVTGLQTLPFLPELAREILQVLAAYQGTVDDPWMEQVVGAIMHELRLGEMARLREIPFVPYYGTVDATQLFLMLLGRYVKWTGDLKFARRVWKHVKLAQRYIRGATIRGFICYGANKNALSNKGWKDSGDSIMHRDGTLAEGPIALCEAQGYLYAAWTGLSNLALELGYTRQSRTFARKAALLKKRFNRDFWMEDRRFVALALDGKGKQCGVVSSNPGHLLDTGILDEDKVHAVAEGLGKPDMFCGWGIRTLSSTEARYNPMSYHDGSVWPHDNSLTMPGLCQTGHHALAHDVMRGMLAAAESDSERRLPELFSGFERKPGDRSPVRYPVSCVPQAWAAGTMFLMLSACLGLQPDARKRELRVVRPSLPHWLEDVSVTKLRVGDAIVDLHFQRVFGGDVRCWVSRKWGDVTVIVER
jgi:glycogen debranching enzyme